MPSIHVLNELKLKIKMIELANVQIEQLSTPLYLNDKLYFHTSLESLSSLADVYGWEDVARSILDALADFDNGHKAKPISLRFKQQGVC